MNLTDREKDHIMWLMLNCERHAKEIGCNYCDDCLGLHQCRSIFKKLKRKDKFEISKRITEM